jgi:hypothetical protein
MNRFLKIYLIGCAFLFLPLIVKKLGGPLGPQTVFYWYTVWAPLVLLVTGAFLSRAHLATHAFCLVMIGVSAWTSYPAYPVLDTIRQINQEVAPIAANYALWLIVADIAVAIFLNRNETQLQ